MTQIDIIRNRIGGAVNNYLSSGEISPTDMRYVLKAIIGEVAEYEITQIHAQLAQKDKVEE